MVYPVTNQNRVPSGRHLLPVWQTDVSYTVWFLDSRHFSASAGTQSALSGPLQIFSQFWIRSAEFKSGENYHERLVLPWLWWQTHGQDRARDSTENPLLWLYCDCADHRSLCVDPGDILVTMWMRMEDCYWSDGIPYPLCTAAVDCWKCSRHEFHTSYKYEDII